MTRQDLQLGLRIKTGWEADDAELFMLAADLHEALGRLHIITSIEPMTAGPARPGERSIDPIVIGALTVVLADSLAHFLGVMEKVRSWIDAFQDGRDVEIECNGNKLKATKISRKTQDELIQFYKDCVRLTSDGTDDRN